MHLPGLAVYFIILVIVTVGTIAMDAGGKKAVIHKKIGILGGGMAGQ